MECGRCAAQLADHCDLCFYLKTELEVHLIVRPERAIDVRDANTLFVADAMGRKAAVTCSCCSFQVGYRLPFGPRGAKFIAFGSDLVKCMGKAFERNAVLKDVYQTEPFRAIESRKSFHGDRLSDVQAQAVISSSSHIAECIASPRPQLATSSPSLLMHLEVGRVYDLSPSSVLFAHGSISDRFRGNRGMRLDDAINAISNGSLLAGSFPPIGAAQDGGQIISIQGNRRLFVHRVLSTLGVLATIRIKIHSWNDWEMQRLRWDESLGRDSPKWERSMSSPNGGAFVSVRSQYRHLQSEVHTQSLAILGLADGSLPQRRATASPHRHARVVAELRATSENTRDLQLAKPMLEEAREGNSASEVDVQTTRAYSEAQSSQPQRDRNIVEARQMLALFDGESYGRDYISFEKFESIARLPHHISDANWSYGALLDTDNCITGWFPTP